MAEDDDGQLAAIARELYAHVPAEFVAARNARAAQLRRAGDTARATQVKALPKATAAAWAVGAVGRHEPGELDALGELGAELRVAQASADPAELRALGKRRRQLTAAATRTAVRIAGEHGVPLSAPARDQVEATWQAVVIDPGAERAVRSLLLVRALEPGADAGSALATDDGDTPVPLRAVPTRRRTTDDEPAHGDAADAGAGSRTSGDLAQDDDGAAADPRTSGDVARERRRAERELRARVRAAERALTDLEDAEEEHTRVEARVLQVAARIEELRREVEAREDELAGLDADRAAAREEREDAAHRAEAAQHDVEETRARLAELSD